MPRRARENTLASFRLALEAGADGIELDVHATCDAVVVVNHDPVLENGDEITELTFQEICSRQPDPEQRIPSLSEVCALVAGTAELFVEIKGRRIESLVAGSVRTYPGRLAIHSFDHELIRRLSIAGFPRRLGILVEDEDLSAVGALMAHCGALDLWPEQSVVTGPLVDQVHERSGRVLPWTVNDASLARRLASYGVDGICTDDVTILPADSP